MTKLQIVQAVGAERYKAACAYHRERASDPSYGGLTPESETKVFADLPHDIESLIWDGDEAWASKIELFFDIYDDMPTYGHLMYVTHHYHCFAEADRQMWWDEIIRRLESRDTALSRPLEYTIWCDYFERSDSVVEAWSHLTAPGRSETFLQKVLRSSGPVPWSLKIELFSRLIGDPEWHEWILRSLYYSSVDYYGEIDLEDASLWLKRLKVKPSKELDEVKAALR